jgi:ferredoxin
MAFVVTRLCRDCVNTACASVCPVDCIYEYKGNDAVTFPNQLFIHPDDCIDCGACEPECPWEAIFDEDDVPEKFTEDIKINAKMLEAESDFEICEFDDEAPRPSREEIDKNTEKWNAA